MSKKGMADVGVLPDSAKMAGNEKVGIKDSGYLDKKGLTDPLMQTLNVLPPGMNIDDQKMADIRSLELKNYSGGLSYPGDGWT